MKQCIYLSLAIVFLAVTITTGAKMKETVRLDAMQIIIYQEGQSAIIDSDSPHFLEVLHESESLFTNADSSYRLIVSKERISEIKEKQIALEIIYREIQTRKVGDRLLVYFTRLLIPLTGEFSNGTVFFAGAYAYALGETKPEYSLVSEYGSINLVLNTQGVDKLKEILRQMSIIID